MRDRFITKGDHRMYLDPTMLLLIPALLLALFAQARVKNTYAKYS